MNKRILLVLAALCVPNYTFAFHNYQHKGKYYRDILEHDKLLKEENAKLREENKRLKRENRKAKRGSSTKRRRRRKH